MSFYDKKISIRVDELLIDEMNEMMKESEIEKKTDYIRSAILFYNRIHKHHCFDKFDDYLRKKEHKKHKESNNIHIRRGI